MSKRNITPCPIIESVAEIIFDRNVGIEASALYGKIYDKMKERYNMVENLPIYQLPEEIRLKDENLKNKPWHKFYNDNFEVLIGGNVIAIVAKKEYQGWTEFKKQINYVFDVFKDENITDSISRVGLKYVDMFEVPIINKINIKINSSLPINETLEMQFRTVLEEKNSLKAVLAIMNNVNIEFQNVQKENISLLDVDIFRLFEAKNSCDFSSALKILEEAHDYQKELFSELVSDDFLIENGCTVDRK